MGGIFKRARRGAEAAEGTATAFHARDLDHDPDRPFYDDHPFFTEQTNHRRWMLTTCIAATAGSLVVGGALLGLFGEDRLASASIASLDSGDIWPSSAVTGKGNFNDEIPVAVDLKPYAVVPVAYQPSRAAVAEDGVNVAPSVLAALDSEPLQSAVQPEISGIYDGEGEPVVLDGSLESPAMEPSNMTTVSKTPPPEPVDETITLAKAGHLVDELRTLGVNEHAAKALASAIDPVYPIELLRKGQQLVVTLDKQQDFFGNEIIYPVRVSFSPGPDEQIVAEADEEGKFAARVDGGEPLERSRYANAPHYRASAKITSSLYAAARDQGVPGYIINQMMQAFAYDVDFQRQIKVGDTFEVFYGNPLSGSSKTRKVLHYASLTLRGKKKTIYRFMTPDGRANFYDETGRSVDKSLMKTPISGARISSGFGMRRHPILGYTKLHAGMDFAAPRGTPIRAAGNGVVVHAAWKGAYGRTVIIKHDKTYKTLYAHMSRIARGLRRGAKVNQGQVIGYVGSTGRSTGPHLHYEVRRNNKPINPRKLRIAGGHTLDGPSLTAFKQYTGKIAAMMDAAPRTTQLAQVLTNQ